MEEIKTIFLYKVKNLVNERTYASDLVTYAAKWDSLTTSVISIFQDLKDVTLESVTPSNKRQELLGAKLTSIVVTQ